MRTFQIFVFTVSFCVSLNIFGQPRDTDPDTDRLQRCEIIEGRLTDLPFETSVELTASDGGRIIVVEISELDGSISDERAKQIVEARLSDLPLDTTHTQIQIVVTPHPQAAPTTEIADIGETRQTLEWPSLSRPRRPNPLCTLALFLWGEGAHHWTQLRILTLQLWRTFPFRTWAEPGRLSWGNALAPTPLATKENATTAPTAEMQDGAGTYEGIDDPSETTVVLDLPFSGDPQDAQIVLWEALSNYLNGLRVLDLPDSVGLFNQRMIIIKPRNAGGEELALVRHPATGKVKVTLKFNRSAMKLPWTPSASSLPGILFEALQAWITSERGSPSQGVLSGSTTQVSLVTDSHIFVLHRKASPDPTSPEQYSMDSMPITSSATAFMLDLSYEAEPTSAPVILWNAIEAYLRQFQATQERTRRSWPRTVQYFSDEDILLEDNGASLHLWKRGATVRVIISFGRASYVLSSVSLDGSIPEILYEALAAYAQRTDVPGLAFVLQIPRDSIFLSTPHGNFMIKNPSGQNPFHEAQFLPRERTPMPPLGARSPGILPIQMPGLPEGQDPLENFAETVCDVLNQDPDEIDLAALQTALKAGLGNIEDDLPPRGVNLDSLCTQLTTAAQEVRVGESVTIEMVKPILRGMLRIR